MSSFLTRVLLVLATSFVSIASLSSPALALTGMVEAFVRSYLTARSYPDSTIADSTRQRAYEQLLQLRANLGLGHVLPAYSDTAAYYGGMTTACAWRSIGPTNINGRVTSIVIDPNNRLRIFAATVGGIWRSMDGGRRWRRVTDNVKHATLLAPARWASVALAIRRIPRRRRSVLAGSSDPDYAISSSTTARDSSQGKGVWRMIGRRRSRHLDQGHIGSGWASGVPNSHQPRHAHGIRRDQHRNLRGHGTRNPTMSWSRLDGADPSKDYDFGCSDVVVNFAQGVVYAGVYRGKTGIADGIWKHDGSDWHRKVSGISPVGIGAVALAMSEQDHEALFARIVDERDGFLHGLYRTSTAAEAFSDPAWKKFAGRTINFGIPTSGMEPDTPGTTMSSRSTRRTATSFSPVVNTFASRRMVGRTGAIARPVPMTILEPCTTTIMRLHSRPAVTSRWSETTGESIGAPISPNPSMRPPPCPMALEHVSHGMINSEIYALAGRQATTTAFADRRAGQRYGHHVWQSHLVQDPGLRRHQRGDGRSERVHTLRDVFRWVLGAYESGCRHCAFQARPSTAHWGSRLQPTLCWGPPLPPIRPAPIRRSPLAWTRPRRNENSAEPSTGWCGRTSPAVWVRAKN